MYKNEEHPSNEKCSPFLPSKESRSSLIIMSNSSIFVSISLDGIRHHEDVKYDIESPTSTTVADFVQRDVASDAVQGQTFSWTAETNGRKVLKPSKKWE